ncbi:MAG: exodeoxyribonuclease VII large subunit [Candidatus Cloacimonadia bacterium]
MNKQPENENIFTVTEITRHIKNILESSLPAVWVKGQVSNYKRHSSGHIYFTLKDEESSLLCVFFRQYNQYLRFELENGMEVICFGQIRVYEKSGQYQLYVSKAIPIGVGELEIAFRKLKDKLEAKGLFDAKWKKPIPQFPTRIGIVTSATGAAIQDIKNVLTRRFPVDILLYSARVQGEDAADEIVAGIETFNTLKNVDVIIIARGGGSIEDIWPFNEEKVAEAIFASEIPVISGVGHEIDFTIADWVADLRAPTPSAAAELVVPDRLSVKKELDSFAQRLTALIQSKFKEQESICRELSFRLERHHPQNMLLTYMQQLDELNYRLKEYLQKLNQYRLIVEGFRRKFTQLLRITYIDNLQSTLMDYHHKLQKLINKKYALTYEKFLELAGKMEPLNPLKILQRGYTITKKDKKIISSIKTIKLKDKLEIIFHDGRCKSEVQEIEKYKQPEV